jgi:hypothetical protein
MSFAKKRNSLITAILRVITEIRKTTKINALTTENAEIAEKEEVNHAKILNKNQS